MSSVEFEVGVELFDVGYKGMKMERRKSEVTRAGVCFADEGARSLTLWAECPRTVESVWQPHDCQNIAACR